jgi:DNA-binding GntR family transcriptional regulator
VAAFEQTPCMYADNYLLLNNYQRKELETYEGSCITYLIENHDPPLSYTRTEIFAIAATEEIALRLRIKIGSPVLKNADTFLSRTDKIIGLGLTHFLTDCYHFYINRRVS